MSSDESRVKPCPVNHSALPDLREAIGKVFRVEVMPETSFEALWRSALVCCTNRNDPTLLMYIAKLEGRLSQEFRQTNKVARQASEVWDAIWEVLEPMGYPRKEWELLEAIKEVANQAKGRGPLAPVEYMNHRELVALRDKLETEFKARGFRIADSQLIEKELTDRGFSFDDVQSVDGRQTQIHELVSYALEQLGLDVQEWRGRCDVLEEARDLKKASHDDLRTRRIAINTELQRRGALDGESLHERYSRCVRALEAEVAKGVVKDRTISDLQADLSIARARVAELEATLEQKNESILDFDARLETTKQNGFDLATEFRKFRHNTARIVCEALSMFPLPDEGLPTALRTVVYECTDKTMRYRDMDGREFVVQDHLWGAMGNPKPEPGPGETKTVVVSGLDVDGKPISEELEVFVGADPVFTKNEYSSLFLPGGGVAHFAKPTPLPCEWPGSEYEKDQSKVCAPCDHSECGDRTEPEESEGPHDDAWADLVRDVQVRPLAPEDDFDPNDPRWEHYAADPRDLSVIDEVEVTHASLGRDGSIGLGGVVRDYQPAAVDPDSRPDVMARLDCEPTAREPDPNMPWVMRVKAQGPCIHPTRYIRPAAKDTYICTNCGEDVTHVVDEMRQERRGAEADHEAPEPSEAYEPPELDPWAASGPQEPQEGAPPSLTDLTGMDPTSAHHEHADEEPKK